MGFGASTVVELAWKINGPVEAEGTIIEDIDIESLVITRSVEDANLAGLDKVVGDDEVLLVWSELEVVGTKRWLFFICSESA